MVCIKLWTSNFGFWALGLRSWVVYGTVLVTVLVWVLVHFDYRSGTFISSH